MEPTNLLLAQALSLGGLVGASCAYAGIVRRRRDQRIANVAAAQASSAATERVGRQIALARIDHTFVKSAYPHRRSQDPGSR